VVNIKKILQLTSLIDIRWRSEKQIIEQKVWICKFTLCG